MQFAKKLIFLVLIGVFVLANFSFAKEAAVEINFFYSKTCPHCAEEKKFLEELEKKYPEIEIKKLGLFERKNIDLLKKFYQGFNVPPEKQGYVPVTFVGENFFVGFSKKTGKDIENCILELLERNSRQEPCKPTGEKISLPFVGEINISKFSPFALAVVLGTLDGFNACAMVALGFLLAVLIATGIRKRVFLIGGTFIFVSGIVYFLFISAWLNLFLVLEQLKIITYLVGIIIVLFSIFLLRDYFHGVICKLCQIEKEKENIFTRIERNLFKKMERISTSKMSLPLVLLGVATVAAGVNLVELVCSFGFPLAFTKVLASWQLPTFHYYFYLLIYVLFYMLDDFLIFIFAVLTLRITQVSKKYLKAIKLISGVFLLALGLIMIFCPELLIFS